MAEQAAQVKAAYIHVPFCARLCPYCDFAVVTGREGETDRYFAALTTELEREEPWEPLGSVYVGGGTPSRVDPVRLGAVLDALWQKHGSTADPEVSIEANPEDWSPWRAEALRAAGFNRVSFGAQSFDPATLDRLGRRHSSSQIVAAVAAARDAGFRSINLDLIYGTPGDGSWERTLHSALDLEPDHLSCYALTVEPGTELFRQVAAGEPAPDPDTQADQWEMVAALAAEAGLVRYEVSNWARPGHAVNYNLAVWAQAEYLSFGLGAHRFRNRGRSQNFRRLDSDLAAVETGHSARVAEEAVTGWGLEIERVFLGIRRTVGVVAGTAGEGLLASVEGSRLAEHGVIELVEGRLIVRKPLLTDAVLRALLDLPPP
ncbi:radical SAM family heme chaperone HemW [soil metagenome]